MRSGILSIGIMAVALGAGSVSAAHATERARFAGIGTGISHEPGGTVLTLPATPTRTVVLADGTAPAAARPRGWVGLDRLQVGSAPRGGLDLSARGGWTSRDDLRRTTPAVLAPLPADLSSLPLPPGDPSSDRPSPMIAGRDIGGVLGLSYKIKPPQPAAERVELVLPPVVTAAPK